nr:NosD domain-containing protein [Bartonella machadoae]
MSKKSLLLCTAAATILLFGTHYNLHAESLEVSTGKREVSNETYETIHAKKEGKIIGTNLTIIGDKDTNPQGGTYPDPAKYAVTAEGVNSSIELLGNTNIKGTNSDIFFGLKVKDGASIKMIGGSIIASGISASFENSKNENILENVRIATPKDNNRPLFTGISVNNSTLTLNKVTVGLTGEALRADNASLVTVSGGSFGGTVYSQSGSILTLQDNVKIMSDTLGLWSRYSQTKIMMTGGEVTGKEKALVAENGHITVADVALKTEGNGIGAQSLGSNGVINLQNATIEDAKIGLYAQIGGNISMTDGTITVSEIGASFTNSKSDQNKLKGVKITSKSEDKPLSIGISADKESSVTLKDVTVTKAEKAIVANDQSQVTISGGSFEAKNATISATNNSTITLTDNTQITSSDGDGVYAEGAGSQITMTEGEVTGKEAALFAEKGHIDVTNVALKTDGNGIGAQSLGANSVINLQNTTIKEVKIGLKAQEGGAISMTEGSIDASDRAVYITGNNSIVHLNNVAISSSSDTSTQKLGNGTRHIPYGISIPNGTIHVEDNGTIDMTGGSIKSSTQAAVTVNNSHDNKLKNVHIHAKKRGIISYGSTLTLEDVTVESTSTAMTVDYESQVTISGSSFKGGTVGVSVAYQSTAFFKDVQIDAKNGLLVGPSSIVMTGGKVTGDVAFHMANGNGKIDATDVTTKTKSQAIALSCPNEREICKHTLNLTKTKLFVEDGIGIFASLAANSNVNLNNSEIHADVLLTERMDNAEIKDQSMLTLTADHSLLEGRAAIEKDARTLLDLKNDTTWIVKTSTKEKDKDGNLLDIAQRARSDLSVLNLNNSKIVFQGPIEEHYHTLHIGSGKPENTAVYNATGNAEIYFNAEWSDGAAIADQKTDRLLIDGDVSGTTAVYVTGHLEGNNGKANTSAAANVRGLSLIQVSGKAKEDSFKLVNGYTTRDGSPDMYTLRAYGPESSQGKADIGQNLFDEKNKNFWDFRLQPKLLETGSGQSVNAPVPQTANYLVMPNALFYSGLTDMAKKNALIANIRTSILGKEEEKNTGFFLSTYGSTGTLSSARGPLKYGYGADIRYAALQAGATLAAIEGQKSSHISVLLELTDNCLSLQRTWQM